MPHWCEDAENINFWLGIPSDVQERSQALLLNITPHPALTSNSPIPSSLRKSHISHRPEGRRARRAITKLLLVSAKPVKYRESRAWGKGNAFQLQLGAGKGGENVSNPLFSIGICSGIKFCFHFLYFIAGTMRTARQL